MLFLFMVCTFVLILFQVNRQENAPNMGLMPFGFYDPDKLHAFRNIKSVTPQFILDCGVSPKV